MLTKLQLNNNIFKNIYTKDWKRLVALCRRLRSCWWRLLFEMLKKNLDVIRNWSCGKKFTIQQYGANSVTNYLNENVSDYIRKKNWSPNSIDLKLLDYIIWDITKKILYKNVKSDTKKSSVFQNHYHTHGINWQKSASIFQSSYGWYD